MRVTLSSGGSNCSAFLILFLVIISLSTRAQINYKGIWQGYITAPGAYNSGYTLHIEEYAGDRISGTAYIYRNENPFQFDGILDFIGTVNRSESRITELVIVRQKMPDEYRRFQNQRIAKHERERHRPNRHHQREIERHDRCDDA
jgi:hypothetical protein